jgi:hypothetical protein
LVSSLLVVEWEVPFQPVLEIVHTFVILEIDVLVFHTPARFFYFAIKPGAPLLTVAEIDMGGEFSLGTRASYGTQKVEGHWRHGGVLYRDNLVKIVADVPDSAENRVWLHAFTTRWKTRLGRSRSAGLSESPEGADPLRQTLEKS